MTKRLGPVLILLLLVPVLSFGQIDLSALNTDVQTLFTSVGRDLSPSLHQMAVSGFDSVGEARLNGWTRFYVTPLSVGLTTFNGLGSVLDKTNAEYPDTWAFTLLEIPTLIKNMAASNETGAAIFETLTTKAALLPSIRMGFGFPLPWDLELLVNGIYIPEALTTWGINLLGDTMADLPIDLKAIGLNFNMFTLGGTLRKILLADKNGFWRPSLSLGASYVYSSTSFGADNFNMAALGQENGVEISGTGTLNMAGKLGFAASTHAIGAVLHVSKRLLFIFTPYLKAAAYYHVSNYDSEFDVSAVLDPNTPTDSSDDIEQALNAPVSLVTEDVSIVLTGGLEINLPVITLFTALSLDLEQPLIDISAFTLDGFALNGLGVNVGLRLQI